MTQILLNALSPDEGTQKAAEQQLEQARDAQFTQFMTTMVAEMQNEQKPLESRQLAGVLAKNALWGKSEATSEQHKQRWLQTDQGTRTQCKQLALQTLASPQAPARSTACSVVSKLAALELPQNSWPELIPALKQAVAQTDDANSRLGALTALGFICQDLSDIDQTECIEAQSNDVLTAVIQGLRKEETNMEIKYAAAQALNHAIEFAQAIFEKDTERNYVMSQVCDATQAPDERVRKESMDVLASIAYYYYPKLPAYIEAISQIAIKAIKQDEQDVGTTALEIWSTIIEEELRIQEEIEETGQSSQPLLNITVQAVSFFVPVLLECLTKQTGDEDEDEWTVFKAAGVCLELVSRCAMDECVDLVMTFVNANVRSENWVSAHQRRQAR